MIKFGEVAEEWFLRKMPFFQWSYDQRTFGHLTENMSYLPNTGNLSILYVTDTGPAVVTQKRVGTDLRKFVPVVRRKYSMQCVLQEGDYVFMHHMIRRTQNRK